MLNPNVGMVVFVLGAVVVGVVIFGGTTLAYFRDQRRIDPPKPGPVQHPQLGTRKNASTGKQSDASHQEAA